MDGREFAYDLDMDGVEDGDADQYFVGGDPYDDMIYKVGSGGGEIDIPSYLPTATGDSLSQHVDVPMFEHVVLHPCLKRMSQMTPDVVFGDLLVGHISSRQIEHFQSVVSGFVGGVDIFVVDLTKFGADMVAEGVSELMRLGLIHHDVNMNVYDVLLCTDGGVYHPSGLYMMHLSDFEPD